MEPRAISRLTPSRACTPPKDFEMSSSATCTPFWRVSSGTLARPLGGELAGVLLGDDAVVRQPRDRVDSPAHLAGLDRGDQRLHGESAFAGRRLRDVGVPRAGLHAGQCRGARAVAD